MSEVHVRDFAQDYDTVRFLDLPNGNIILVGEHHSSVASRRLAQNVLQAATPGLVAIESCPSQQNLVTDSETNVSEGADAAINYARATDSPIGLIDKSQSSILSNIAALPPEPVPFDPPEPDEDGDISAGATQAYRTRLQNEFPQRHEVLISQREHYMAGVVTTLHNMTDGDMVVILGASHLHSVTDKVESGSVRPRDVPESRIQSVE